MPQGNILATPAANAHGLKIEDTEGAVNSDPWFLEEPNRIACLVLASRALESAAQELADDRAGQGLRLGLATFEDVCDWLTGDLRPPETIPELLAYAQTLWAEAPWLVMLAGNGHYDYRGALNNEVDHGRRCCRKPRTASSRRIACWRIVISMAIRPCVLPATRVDIRDKTFVQWRWPRFAPAELAHVSVSGAPAANFRDYALGGEAEPVLAELPEFGFPPPEEVGADFILRGKRRIKRADAEYRLFLSRDLEVWLDDSAILEEIGSEPDPDGVMETVRTRVKRTDAECTYWGVRAKKK